MTYSYANFILPHSRLKEHCRRGEREKRAPTNGDKNTTNTNNHELTEAAITCPVHAHIQAFSIVIHGWERG